MRPRRNNRRDSNESEIVHALEGIGCTVIRLNEIDLLVLRIGFDGTIVRLGEVKTDEGRLTERQRELIKRYPDVIRIWRSPVEALRDMGVQTC